MGVVGLAWYSAAVLAVLAVLASAITWAPGPGRLAQVLPVAFLAGAVLAAGAAVGLGRLPPAHWLRRSRPVRVAVAAVAITATALLVLVG
jgi:hypothetical protein